MFNVHNLQIRLEKFTDQTKNTKKYILVGIALSLMTILKALKLKYCLSLGTRHKYVVQFTEPTFVKRKFHLLKI